MVFTRVLVTGAAGFIGMHTSLRLLERGAEVVGYDNLDAHYDPSLKAARFARLEAHSGFTFIKGLLEDRDGVARLFAEHRLDQVVNLAAQAGVSFLIEDPHAYVGANVVGFVKILVGHGALCRKRYRRAHRHPAVRFTPALLSGPDRR